MDIYLTPPSSPAPSTQINARIGWPWPQGDASGFDWIDALELTDPDKVVMLISTEFIEATATWVEYHSLHISEYYAASQFHILGRYIFRSWNVVGINEIRIPRPKWITKEPYWRVVRRDFVVRQVAHAARKPYNMLMAERMISWARGVTTHPDSIYRHFLPSRLIWPVTEHQPHITPTPEQLEHERERRENRRDHGTREAIN